MSTSTLPPADFTWPATARAARRLIAAALPGSTPVDIPAIPPDAYATRDEPPAIVAPEIIGNTGRVTELSPARGETTFDAFLDGSQSIQVINQQDGVLFLWGTVAAAVRIRRDRRLATWKLRGPVVERRLYAPLRYAPLLDDRIVCHAMVVDTSAPDDSGNIPSRHPAALLDRAVQLVRRDRERLELSMAESWCSSGSGLLYVDGSIQGNPRVAASPHAIGVIKTHRVLYAGEDKLADIIRLRARERSPVFVVSRRGSSPVASWYLRLRRPDGHDPMWGLVRVEARITDSPDEQADDISRRILAETSPLALPDSRWDRMAYGVRDTEQFLRAVT